MTKLATIQHARVTIGYDQFIMPLAEATKLVNILATMKPVEGANYSLAHEFRPELQDRYVEKEKSLRVELTLVDNVALPYFDQDTELARCRLIKHNPEIVPFCLAYKDSKYKLIDPEGVELINSYSFSDVLKMAREQKQMWDGRHHDLRNESNMLTDGTSTVTEVQFTEG